MPLFKKSILSVGKKYSPDGVIDVTPERLSGFAKTFKRMSKAGLQVPVGWDHSDAPEETIPVKSMSAGGSIKAANGVGYLHDVKLASDGQSAELVLDLRDPKAIEKAEQNTVQISPIIHDQWRDGDGRLWKDCFGHIDLVHHPVDHRQTEFQSVAVACGLRMSLNGGKSLSKVYRMADDQDDKGEVDSEASDTSTEANANPDLPESDGGAAKQRFEAIIAHLAEAGYVLPSDTDASNFEDRLLTALMTAAAAKKKADEEAESKEDEAMPEINESSPAFAAMSLQARGAYNAVTRMHRMALAERLQKVLETGRCSTAEHEQHSTALGAVKMSLSEDGTPSAPKVEEWIASREALPAGAVWDPATRTQRMSVSEASIPEGIDDNMSAERAAELARWALGGKPAAATA